MSQDSQLPQMTKRTFFTRDEVVIHNSRDDIWVIINGTVIDLTNFFQKRVESDTVNDVSMNFGCILGWKG